MNTSKAPETQATPQHCTKDWAESKTLFLLTCYDIWSATPHRHCAPMPDDRNNG